MFYFTDKLEQPIKEFDSSAREEKLKKAFITRDELIDAYEESVFGKIEPISFKYRYDESDAEVVSRAQIEGLAVNVRERINGNVLDNVFVMGQREPSPLESFTSFTTEIDAGGGNDVVFGHHVGSQVQQKINVLGGEGHDIFVNTSRQGTYFNIGDMEEGENLQTTNNYDQVALQENLWDGSKVYKIFANDHSGFHTITVPVGHEIEGSAIGDGTSGMNMFFCVPEG